MKLQGSCQCGKIIFRVESTTPYPFNFCYCTICRKTTGGLAGCNIMGEKKTLKVKGHPKKYHAILRKKGKPSRRSKAWRWFCGDCGTHLYLTDERWPEGVWPNAGAIDTELPVPEPKTTVHLMLNYKPKWVPRVLKGGDRFPEYPKLSIAEWHERYVGKRSKKQK